LTNHFNFAGQGKMVICGETDLYYATLAADGSYVDSEMRRTRWNIDLADELAGSVPDMDTITTASVYITL
jgi:hypothetical protein